MAKEFSYPRPHDKVLFDSEELTGNTTMGAGSSRPKQKRVTQPELLALFNDGKLSLSVQCTICLKCYRPKKGAVPKHACIAATCTSPPAHESSNSCPLPPPTTTEAALCTPSPPPVSEIGEVITPITNPQASPPPPLQPAVPQQPMINFQSSQPNLAMHQLPQQLLPLTSADLYFQLAWSMLNDPSFQLGRN